MEKQYLVKLDVYLGILETKVINFNQLNTGTCKICFELTSNKQALDLTDKRVTFEVSTPSGATIEDAILVTDAAQGKAEYVLANDMITEHGMHYAEINVYTKDNTKLLTFNKFRYIVNGQLGEKNVTVDTRYTTLQELIFDVENLKNQSVIDTETVTQMKDETDRLHKDVVAKHSDVGVKHQEVVALAQSVKADSDRTKDNAQQVSVDKGVVTKAKNEVVEKHEEVLSAALEVSQNKEVVEQAKVTVEGYKGEIEILKNDLQRLAEDTTGDLILEGNRQVERVSTEGTKQVNLAKEEVSKASEQANIAKEKSKEANMQAERAKTEADRAGNQAQEKVNNKIGLNGIHDDTNFNFIGEGTKITKLNVGSNEYNIGGITEIPPRSITPQNTTFFISGKNMFDKNSSKKGYFINHLTGEYSNNTSHTASDFIDINPGAEYVFNREGRYCFYDNDKQFINGALTQSVSFSAFTTPLNAKYVVFSVGTTNVDNIQLEKGDAPTAYEPYYCKIPLSVIEEKDIVFTPEMITKGSISEDKTIFFEKTSNMIDKSQCTPGFVSGDNGQEYEHETYWKTEFIKIEPNTIYSCNVIYVHSAFYDANKKYVSRVEPIENTFTSPENAEYVRFTIHKGKSDLDSAYMCIGDKILPYEPFGYYLKDKYIKKQSKHRIVNLPSKLYALVGQEFNIYFDNIVEGRDIDYSFDVTCSIGMQLERCFRVNPETKGEYPIIIDVYKDGDMVAKATSKIIVSSTQQGNGATKKVIIIGDSTTNNGICVTKLNQNFASDSMNITTLGTRGTGINKHEGRSGWTFRQYIEAQEDSNVPDVVNAFYNPTEQTFDFGYYLDNNNIEKPDYVFINLGINDTFSFVTDKTLLKEIDLLFQRCDNMINSIKSVDTNIKVGIAITIPPNYSQDAFGKAYKCNQTRDRYKRNNILWCNELIKRFDNRESENIYLIPLHCNIDTKYNFGFEEMRINARNTMTYQSPIANGGVHPHDSGYWQCADTYWYFLKSFEV